MKKFNVGLFRNESRSGYSTYLRDFQPSWPGFVGIFEVEAETGEAAKKAVAGLARANRLDRLKSGAFAGMTVVFEPAGAELVRKRCSTCRWEGAPFPHAGCNTDHPKWEPKEEKP